MIEEYLAYEDRLAQEGKLDESCASAIWGWTLSEDYFRLGILPVVVFRISSTSNVCSYIILYKSKI